MSQLFLPKCSACFATMHGPGAARAVDAAVKFGADEEVLHALLRLQGGSSNSRSGASNTATAIQEFQSLFQQTPISIDPEQFLQAAEGVPKACLCQQLIPPAAGLQTQKLPLHAALLLRFPPVLVDMLLKLQPDAAATPIPMEALQAFVAANPTLPLLSEGTHPLRVGPNVRPFLAEEGVAPTVPGAGSNGEVGQLLLRRQKGCSIATSEQGLLPLHFAESRLFLEFFAGLPLRYKQLDT